MKTHNNLIVVLSLLCGASQGATYSYNLSGDNDLALYSSNGAGPGISNVVQHVQQNTRWQTPTSGSFTTSGDYIHIIALNYDTAGAIGGLINGIDISSIPWEVTGNTSGFLTGYPAFPTFDSSESFNPDINNAQMLMELLAFNGPAPLTGSGTFGVSVPGVTDSLDVPSRSVVIFRTQAANFVPEPSSALLLGLGSLSVLLRRKRS